MKIHYTFLVLLFASTTFAQTIRRVNNNPAITGTNIYSSLQAAHDAAVGGDIIYIESSSLDLNYGSLDVSKPLTFIGPGYDLWSNPGLQASNYNPRTAAVVSFNAGSSGSTLYGLQVDYNGYVRIAPGVSNIVISRCRLSWVLLEKPTNTQSYSNIKITQNFMPFGGVADCPISSCGNLSGTVTGIQISNNIMGNGCYLSSQFSGTMTNNTFYGNGINMNVSNFAIINNIWWSTGSVGGVNNNISNNVASGAQFGTSNGNLANVVMDNVFVGGMSQDGGYKIKAGSPTIGAGFNGVDCGAYGGADPYVLSGIPPYPTVNKLITSGIGNSTIPISVTISTKSNN